MSQIVPTVLMWSFTTNAENTSVAVGNDGTTIATCVSNTFLDFNISGAFGQLLNNDGTPGFHFYGTDSDFDNGESPATVAIDPNGMAVEIHETSLTGTTQLWIDAGWVGGGQGSLTGGIETDMSGQDPCIVAVGPGQFLVSAKVYPTALPTPALGLWAITVTQGEDGAWSVSTVVVNIDYTYMPAFNPEVPLTLNCKPRLSCYGGLLAVSDTGSAAPGGIIGPYDLENYNFTPCQTWANDDTNTPPGSFPRQTVAIGRNSTVYYSAITGEEGNWTVTLWAGTYEAGAFGTLSFPFAQNLFIGEFDLPANYPLAVDMVYTNSNGLNGLVMAVLSYCNCIDLFYIPVDGINI